MSEVATLTAFALSTTFTPPATCTENHFTMLERLDYRIYKNYPDPAGTILTDCYPTQYLSSYFSQMEVKTPLPPIAPIVCPVGYTTATSLDNGYRAFCPSGFSLAAPSASSIATRPAYGATCYSDIKSLLVTSYNSAGSVATSTWTAQSTGSQAYALVIEGFAKTAPTGTDSSATAKKTVSPTGTAANPIGGANTTAEKKSEGTGTGGFVGMIGSVAGLCLLLAVAL
ncbi:hypothetical protein BLS_000211 [Venturia inaequalis]|uniref:Uncharacterized protein n=1 Tax=Venturia inaequalis TaxID=5025 RepID=A0A8H3YLZ3_VENIN|nr:hypothetical protein BLS_000211 [Venturia inaequalis]KAE9981581.1 hypothetical protein EG328_011520 [Venturia inaequalis]KAE9983402.1 hypothetical protein EG327_005485 [Venturia inaequalis]RDI78260.1 hypothetical protein Vi05172_g11757 [Venturia inaequalis]